MNATESAIGAQSLHIDKGKKPVIRGLTFEIKQGTITGLIGPSGSGKTTLMRAIVGVQAISSGALNVLGLRAGSKSLRERIGYVTQSPSVYGDLTVEQNLEYFASITRASRTGVAKVIEQVQLAPQRKQVVDTLSGGQRARVSLAVALLGEPDLLVLDEPTVGLDPVLRQELWGLFAELASEGKTLLISSHVMDEAEKCSELLLLSDGELLWGGGRTELLRQSGTTSVEAAFIKSVKKEER